MTNPLIPHRYAACPKPSDNCLVLAHDLGLKHCTCGLHPDDPIHLLVDERPTAERRLAA